jgi:hypothetical protein
MTVKPNRIELAAKRILSPVISSEEDDADSEEGKSEEDEDVLGSVMVQETKTKTPSKENNKGVCFI